MRRKLFCLFAILAIMAAGSLSGWGGCSSQQGEDEFAGYPNDAANNVQELPSEEEMGTPVYDKNVDADSVANLHTESNEGVMSIGVIYKTTDDWETVVSWYKDQFGEPDEISELPDGHFKTIWRFSKDGWNFTITISSTDAGTEISLWKSRT